MLGLFQGPTQLSIAYTSTASNGTPGRGMRYMCDGDSVFGELKVGGTCPCACIPTHNQSATI